MVGTGRGLADLELSPWALDGGGPCAADVARGAAGVAVALCSAEAVARGGAEAADAALCSSTFCGREGEEEGALRAALWGALPSAVAHPLPPALAQQVEALLEAAVVRQNGDGKGVSAAAAAVGGGSGMGGGEEEETDERGGLTPQPKHSSPFSAAPPLVLLTPSSSFTLV